MNVHSKTVRCQTSAQKLYNFLSEFNNFTHLIPSDKVQGWTTTGDTCSFSVGGFLTLKLAFADRTPYSRIVIAPATGSGSPVPFKAIVHLKDNGDDSTQVYMEFESEGGNPMIAMMLKPKLCEMGDKLMEQLQHFSIGL